ncbi:MAG: hypothetical protein E6J14_09330 [Chloroflexi bacterium]|nr:MAG: hypothetical protein E6J14_09330 [Chloroflexota bacterium]
MSFLIDPPWLVANGAIIERTFPEPIAKRLEQATVAVFVATSVSLYLNLEWTRGLWEACRAESGRDWMLNSGVFRFDHRRPPPWVHAVAAALFATYPLWPRLGRRLAARRA